jgi:peptidoglycan/LPS O-acetylase OafA/YrhL
VTLGVVLLVVQPPLLSTVAHLLTVQSYVPGADIGAFSQSWSVPTELSFYVALPLVVVGLDRLRRRDPRLPVRVLLASSAVVLVVLALLPPPELGVDVIVERWLPGRWPDFAAGMLLAELASYPGARGAATARRLARDTTGCLLLAGGAYVLATTAVAGPLTLGTVTGLQLSTRHLLSAVVAFALLAPLTIGRGGWWAAVLAAPPVRWVGTVSYGLFLWHLPVLTGLLSVTGLPEFHGGAVPLLALGLPISLALAWASLHLVELPAMRWAARRAPLPRPTHRR